MNYTPKLLLISFLIFFGCNIYAQSEKSLVPLEKVLSQIENQHNIIFNYLENDVENVSIIAPSKKLTLTKKIAYLQSKTKLVFEKISGSIYAVHNNQKRFKICGYILSKENQLPIVDAEIILDSGEKTTSNSDGYFEVFTSQATNYTISSSEFATIKTTGEHLKSGEIAHFFLNEKVKNIEEVFLNNKLITSGISKRKDGSYLILPQKGGLVPGLIEPDVLQTMQYLPGIYSTDESISNINVRSGTHDQNLFLWNGIKLYQTGHFFGLVSTINPYLSNEIKIYKNASPAFYGEGIASVVDISTDNHFSDKNKYSFGMNMLNADVYAKINLSKTNFIEVAARKSYTELLQTPTYKEYFKKAFQNSTVTNFNTQESVDYSAEKNFKFYDISTKFVQKIGQKDVLTLDFITIDDQLDVSHEGFEDNEDDKSDDNFTNNNTIYQRNFGTSFTWNHNWNHKNSSSLIISNSQYELDSKITTLEDIYSKKKEENYVSDSSLKFENRHQLSKKYSINAGYQLNLWNTKDLLEDSTISLFQRTYQKVGENALYAEAKMKDSITRVFFSAGVRANYVSQFKKTWLEPRLQFTYGMNKNLFLNILAEEKSQIISQQISQQNDFFGVEKRRWVLANNSTIPIQRSKQASLGLDYNDNNWLLTIEAYYKKVHDINTASQGFQNQFENVKTIGDYDVKGIELLLQKKIRHVFAWVNYNYTDSKYDFPEITPEVFVNNFQINHYFSCGVNYEKNGYKFSLGSKWHSGKPETDILNSTINIENPIINYGTPNNKSLENFFQVDASASYSFRTQKKLKYQFNFAVLNLFNKKNEISEFYRINTSNNSIEQIKSYSFSRTFNVGFRISY